MIRETLSNNERQKLLDAARDIAERAHAPYSNFRVGAAVLTGDGRVYQGCNVENASYGLTICAERAAIFAAVAGEGASTLEILAIAVLTANESPATPCGACRQVMLEFNPDAPVLYRGQEGMEETTVRDLLPSGFSLE